MQAGQLNPAANMTATEQATSAGAAAAAAGTVAGMTRGDQSTAAAAAAPVLPVFCADVWVAVEDGPVVNKGDTIIGAGLALPVGSIQPPGPSPSIALIMLGGEWVPAKRM